MVVSLLEDSVPTKVLASLSRNNVPQSNNEDDVFPLQSLDILLKVPPNNAAPTDVYRLHVEGYKKGEGKDALVYFEIFIFKQIKNQERTFFRNRSPNIELGLDYT